jgi:hypothetical protein
LFQNSFGTGGHAVDNSARLKGDRMAGYGIAPESNSITNQLQQKLILEHRMKGGAGWFYWVAGLSIINSIIILSGSDWHFLAGLGITDLISLVVSKAGTAGTIIGIMLDAMVAAVFILFGVFASKRQTWAFVVGMTFYALDALLLIPMEMWLGMAFHAFVLFQIFKGMQAGNQIKELEAMMPPTIVAG